MDATKSNQPQQIGRITENIKPLQTQLNSEKMEYLMLTDAKTRDTKQYLLGEIPICPCGKYPRVVSKGVIWLFCDVCNKEKEIKRIKDDIRERRKEKTERINAKLSYVIPPLFTDAHLRDLSPKLKAVILNLPKQKGLFLYGTAGVGKSYTMAAILRRFVMAGKSCKRVQWDKLCLEIRSSFNSGYSELSVLRPYLETDILVVEDIGTTTSINGQESDFSLRVLLLILDDRVEHCKPTFLTSNKSPEQIGKSFDSRIESRIYAACDIVPVSGQDKRKQEASGNGPTCGD